MIRSSKNVMKANNMLKQTSSNKYQYLLDTDKKPNIRATSNDPKMRQTDGFIKYNSKNQKNK